MTAYPALNSATQTKVYELSKMRGGDSRLLRHELYSTIPDMSASALRDMMRVLALEC